MNDEALPPGAWRMDPFTRVLRYVRPVVDEVAS